MSLACMIAVAGLIGPLAFLLQAAEREPTGKGPFLVVFAPWVESDRMLVEAGGRIVGLEKPLIGQIVSGDSSFVSQIRAAGAWLVLDSELIAALCRG